MKTLDLFQPKDIVNRRGIRRFLKRFERGDNWHNASYKLANLGYGWIHYSIIRVFKPSRVLCVGSRYGFIPAVCALACRDNGRGVVDFIDAGYDQNNPRHRNHWGGVGFWRRQSSRAIFEKFGLDDYIRLHVMTSYQFKKNYRKRTWGYIHLDGDHSYLGVARDFKSFWPNLARQGILALHDVRTTRALGGLSYGVARLWKELKASKKYQLFEFPGTCGLGLVQK